ncbi:ComF family protein [bacterium]|nr:ComF family protein [bacterium]
MYQKFFDKIVSLFFPRRCVICSKEGEIFCKDCLALVTLLDNSCCPGCGSYKINLPGEFCSICKKELHLDGLISAAPYNDPLIKKTISLFKYPPFAKDLAKSFAFLIISQLRLQNNKFGEFILSYIPLDRASLRRRGFNQSKLLVQELGKELNLPVYTLLEKIKKTKPQKNLNKEERKENVQNAFCVVEDAKELVQNKKIIIVDDVYTTGATLNEAARVLKQAGAKKIWGITIAREF